MSPPARTKRRKRPRTRFELRKAVFVLPSLVTLCSILCGFYAIALCVGALGPDAVLHAALAIFIGTLLDLFDGRIARLTKTQTEFGRQLDSLADVVSFGTAPGILLYAWGLRPLGLVGLLAAFAYVACGALRLARFNVLSGTSRAAPASREALKGPDLSVGLPIPPAAGTVVALVLCFHPDAPATWDARALVAAVPVVLGVLMVSNVHFRTFKDLRPTWPVLLRTALLAVPFAAITVWWSPAVALAAVFASYIGLGLVEELGQKA